MQAKVYRRTVQDCKLSLIYLYLRSLYSVEDRRQRLNCTQQQRRRSQTTSFILCSVWCTLIEIDTLEYQQTEKIETELKDVNRIRANRCTQLCPGSPSGASHSHNTIYYSFPAYSPLPLKKGSSQMESSVQDNPAAPSPCQMREF
jgi:hypothetical protein